MWTHPKQSGWDEKASTSFFEKKEAKKLLLLTVMGLIRVNALHADVLAALHGETFPEEPWSAENFRALLAQPTITAWLDERGGFLLLRIAADEAEILTLGSILRRQGIARALMETGINHAKAAGVTKIFLEVADQNIAAKALYTELGFTQLSLRKHYYANGDDALLLGVEL
jgi:ribosomal-protein-alanine N-acetyltransferase